MHIHMTTLVLVFMTTVTAWSQDCPQLTGEARLAYDVNRIDAPALRTVSTVTSDALLPLTIGMSAGLWAAGVATDDRYAQETGLQSAVTLGVTYGLTLALKHIVDRPRPYQAYPGCITNYRNDADGSFPSGHSAGSAALATTLSLRYPEWYVIVPASAYALYTGFSRMHLGMHYLSDVLAGYALGAGTALLVHLLNDELFRVGEPLLTAKDPVRMSATPTTLFAVSIPF